MWSFAARGQEKTIERQTPLLLRNVRLLVDFALWLLALEK